MLEVKITEEMITLAKNRRASMPSCIKNSIMSGERTFEGCLGEVVVASYLNAEYITTHNFDLIHKEKRLEVKTKVRTVLPKSFYEVSIANYNTRQMCDNYVFVSLLSPPDKSKDYKIAHIVGYYPKETFFDNAKFLRKGDVDPSNNYVVRATCWNMRIKNLMDIKDLK